MSSRAARLHESPWRGVLHVTGGGSGFLAELLGEPGASATVLEATVPYASAALRALLGATPEQACSEATARAMAMAAFQRALALTSLEPDAAGAETLFGFACTASLATNREKRGAHRAHIAVQTAADTFSIEVALAGDRAEEERALVECIWQELGLALGLDATETPARVRKRASAEPGWQALILGDANAHSTNEHDGGLLLPGAFNPLHRGHRQMLEIAEALTGRTGAYELSVANVDKPMLDYMEIARRLEQFERPLWLTHLPTFLEKARHFPEATFAVGVDTLLRIVDASYYYDEAAMRTALAELHDLNTRFVVFGRDLGETFVVLDDVIGTLPAELAERCLGVDADTFRDPISSTKLRAR
jgi:nicotinamide mononucleotide (NMN) deamidase PncC